MPLSKADILASLFTLAIGLIGAAAASVVSFPAPWLTGSALFVSIAGVFGVRVFMPNILRDLAFIIIGITMGAGITQETIATAAKWPLSILTLFIALIIIMVLSAKLLHHTFGFDRNTALLSSAPGHLTYVLSLSEDTKASIPVISIVQTIRVLTLTLAVPYIIAVVYPDLTPKFVQSGPSMHIVGLVIIATLAILAGNMLKKLRFPAALLMGGMLVAGLFQVTETVTGIIPFWLTIPAFTLMGVLIGSRFDGVTGTMLYGALRASIVITIIAIIISGAAALMVGLFIDVPPAHLLISFAPGGLETMAAMGIMLNANPAFIAAHHILRILFLTAAIPVILKNLRL